MFKHLFIKVFLFFLKVLNTFRYRFLNFILPNLGKLNNQKIIFSTIPFCEQKTFITGLGIVKIGKLCKFGYKPGGFSRNGSIEFQSRMKDAKIIIGNNIFTNNNVFICAANLIEIGDNALIGQNVTIMDFEAHGIPANERNQVGVIGTVLIGENVWIGNDVVILKNTVIGNNSIVATGAVVNGKFPENVIIGGVPAKIIKSI